jgi:hypothetical protein
VDERSVVGTTEIMYRRRWESVAQGLYVELGLTAACDPTFAL